MTEGDGYENSGGAVKSVGVRKIIANILRSEVRKNGSITGEQVGVVADRITKALTFEVSYPSRGNCWFCGVPLVSTGNGETRRTVDHLIPRSRGGGVERSNTVDACLGCNSDKGRLTLQEYRAVVSVRTGATVVFWGESHIGAGTATRSLAEVLGPAIDRA